MGAGTCSTVIPHMFDAKIFVETAERLQLEAAELQRQRENAEIAALGAAKVGAKSGEEEESKEVEVSQEDVEKILIQLFASGESRSQLLPPETLYSMLMHSEAQVQACQLNEHEVTGLIAEMGQDITASGQVAFAEYVKRVVPLIFEMRRNQLLSAYLRECAFEKLQISKPDLKKLDSIFPLMPSGWKPKDDIQNLEAPRPSGARLSGRQGSKQRTGSKQSRSGSKQNSGFDHEALRVEGRARLQLGGNMGQRRRTTTGSKELPASSKDTPNGRGYYRRRMLLGLLDSED